MDKQKYITVCKCRGHYGSLTRVITSQSQRGSGHSTASWDGKDWSSLWRIFFDSQVLQVNNMQTPESVTETDVQTARPLSQFLCFSPEQHHSLTGSTVQRPHLNQVQPSFSATSQQQTAAAPLLSGFVPACCVAGVLVSSQTEVKTLSLNKSWRCSPSHC